MKIVSEVSLWNFEGWSGAEETIQVIIENDKVEEFEQLIEELFPEGINETHLNDLLRFEDNWVFEMLGIVSEEEEEEEE